MRGSAAQRTWCIGVRSGAGTGGAPEMQHRQPAAAITAFPALSCHSKAACAACVVMMMMMHLCAQREHLYCACPRSRLLLPAYTQRGAARVAIPTHSDPPDLSVCPAAPAARIDGCMGHQQHPSMGLSQRPVLLPRGDPPYCFACAAPHGSNCSNIDCPAPGTAQHTPRRRKWPASGTGGLLAARCRAAAWH